jgi:hypothetical protein
MRCCLWSDQADLMSSCRSHIDVSTPVIMLIWCLWSKLSLRRTRIACCGVRGGHMLRALGLVRRRKTSPQSNDGCRAAGHLLSLFAEWVPHAETSRKSLVDNPAHLYGF